MNMAVAATATDGNAGAATPQPDYAIYGERQGRWRLDSLFDDRDLAMFEAQQLTRNGRYSAVKVEVRGAGGPPTTLFQSGGATAPVVAPLRRTRGHRRASGRAKVLTLVSVALGATALAVIFGVAV
jgi:hypothetical protein